MATKQRATISDVAERAGVSRSAVSGHLNNKGRIGEAARARIHAAIEELEFTPNGLIRAMQNRRTLVMGLLIGGLDALKHRSDDSYTLPLLSGVYEAADKIHHDILLYTGWPGRAERSSGRDFLDGRVDGLLWIAPPPDSAAVERIAVRGGLPVVTLLSRHVPPGVGYVNADNIGGARQIVAHLAQQGHRRIAFAGPVHASNFRDRLDGYAQGLQEAGLIYDPALLAIGPELASHDRDIRASGTAAYGAVLDGWLALPHPPTAIFVCTDQWAACMGQAVLSRNRRIPGDIALAGFDDSLLAETVFGGLTTIRQPFEEIGSRAVEHLLRLIEGEASDNCRSTLPVTLIARATT